MIACGLVVCALALDQLDAVMLACKGSFDFRVELDLSLGRLLRAPAAEVESFELRDAGDAVFFVRDREIAGRNAFEWISISRVSGRYAHFVAFRDAASGSLESSTLMTAAGCEMAK
jgi:hypothetical protein